MEIGCFETKLGWITVKKNRGNVCGQNKLLLIIPCHRIIRSDGKLGGFSGRGGIKLKKRLLNLEKSVS